MKKMLKNQERENFCISIFDKFVILLKAKNSEYGEREGKTLGQIKI